LDNALLLNHVEKVLGKGKPTSKGNYSFNCPFCSRTNKLEINFTPDKHQRNPWHCWTCDSRGKTIYALFKKAKINPKYIAALKPLIPQIYNGVTEVLDSPPPPPLELPKEYKELHKISPSDIKAHKAIQYLKSRGLSKADILKYNIGYADGGIYNNHIIIPSYDKDYKLNYFIARSLDQDAYNKYKNPPTDRNIIIFESFINWNLPIILCEGIFDAIAIKRNAIPILGKNISPYLLGKILNHSKEIYISLDKDAQSQALKYAKKFIDEGKQVYLVNLPEKDPSDMGFIKYTEFIKNIHPLTFSDLLEQKLLLI